MNDAEHQHHHDAGAHSGCGCSAKAAPAAPKPATSSCCGGHGDHAAHADQHAHNHGAPAEKARDPVCGMMVDPATSKHRLAHRGETFYFCSAGCHTKFEADPAKYLDDIKALTAPEMEGRGGGFLLCGGSRHCRLSG